MVSYLCWSYCLVGLSCLLCLFWFVLLLVGVVVNSCDCLLVPVYWLGIWFIRVVLMVWLFCCVVFVVFCLYLLVWFAIHVALVY